MGTLDALFVDDFQFWEGHHTHAGDCEVVVVWIVGEGDVEPGDVLDLAEFEPRVILLFDLSFVLFLDSRRKVKG